MLNNTYFLNEMCCNTIPQANAINLIFKCSDPNALKSLKLPSCNRLTIQPRQSKPIAAGLYQLLFHYWQDLEEAVLL